MDDINDAVSGEDILDILQHSDQEDGSLKLEFASQKEVESFCDAYCVVLKVVDDMANNLNFSETNIARAHARAGMMIQKYPELFQEFYTSTILSGEIAMRVIRQLSIASKKMNSAPENMTV